MKIVKSSHISPFGGLNFVIEEFDQLDLGDLLEKELPCLSNQSHYGWRDIFYSFWSIFFCGGDCAEDLGKNFKRSLAGIPLLKTPSPDRILNRMQELSTPSVIYDTPRGNSKHEFNHNERMSRLNIKLLKKLSTFKNRDIVLDYDNTLLFSNKADANMTYKKQFGYSPGVGLIGKHVVYVENRNGNSDPQTLQQDTLQRMFDLLKAEKISVDKFRADSAAYQLLTLDVISKNSKKFYVRTRMSEALINAISKIENWEQVQSDTETVFRGDIKFTPFKNRAARSKQEHLLKEYRLVVTKVKRIDGQINLFSGEAYNYYGILTNDEELANDQVVCFYNQRGAAEKEFDVLKNDFGWSNMPFSKLEQNTVFLILTAICRNLYNHIIHVFSNIYKGLSPIFRIKKFIFRFICIPAKWVKGARSWKLRMYGDLSIKT